MATKIDATGSVDIAWGRRVGWGNDAWLFHVHIGDVEVVTQMDADEQKSTVDNFCGMFDLVRGEHVESLIESLNEAVDGCPPDDWEPEDTDGWDNRGDIQSEGTKIGEHYLARKIRKAIAAYEEAAQ